MPPTQPIVPTTSASNTLSDYMARLWRTVAVVALAVISVWMISLLVNGLLVLFAGILFAVFLNQLSRVIQRQSGLSYGVSLSIVVLSIVSIVAATGYFMGSRINEQVTEFSKQFLEASDRIADRLEQSEILSWLNPNASDNAQGLMPSTQSMISSAGSSLLTLVSALGGLIVILFLGLYLAINPSQYRGGLVRLFPPAGRQRLDNVLLKVGESLWAWILGRLAAMALIAISSALGLWMIGIPLSVTLGVIAGLLNFVPNLGPLIASIPPLLFGLQQGGHAALYVVILYLALQLIESYFITPLIDQQQVKLPPALTLAAQLLLGMLAGFMGLLLATPLLAVAHVLIRELYVKDTLEAGCCDDHLHESVVPTCN